MPLPDPGLSIFTWKGIDIYHKEGILKIGTDAILLATWVSKMAIAPTRILDVGCGSGVLTILLASHFKKAHTIAIDIQPDAVELTKLNATKAGILNRVRVLPLDILVDRLEEMTGVDLVVSNPPFFL